MNRKIGFTEPFRFSENFGGTSEVLDIYVFAKMSNFEKSIRIFLKKTKKAVGASW